MCRRNTPPLYGDPSGPMISATLTLVIWLLSTTSGGHVNPAVSFGFYMKGDLSATELLLYTLSQVLGATASIYTYSLLA